MAIGEVIETYRKGANLSQKDLADKLHMDRSLISRIESGERKLPEHHDAAMSGLNWRIALQIADERTGGYISNVLEDVPNLDLHPAAMKEMFMCELVEAQTAMEALRMSRHIDPKKRKEAAERVWHEVRDVIEKGLILTGVIEEEFGLDAREMIKRHEYQLRKGER